MIKLKRNWICLIKGHIKRVRTGFVINHILYDSWVCTRCGYIETNKPIEGLFVQGKQLQGVIDKKEIPVGEHDDCGNKLLIDEYGLCVVCGKNFNAKKDSVWYPAGEI